ncbi:MAG: MerR family transcriptional regulator [Shimia sp.]
MSTKKRDAFRTISEVAEWLEVAPHVLRFWESKFPQLKPTKRAGGRRYYRPVDMMLIGGIKRLLYDDGVTIKGVQKILKERGVKYVSSLSAPVDGADPVSAEEVDLTANVVSLNAPKEAPEATAEQIEEPVPEAPFIEIPDAQPPEPPTQLHPVAPPPAAVQALRTEDLSINGLSAVLQAKSNVDPVALRSALAQAITLRERLRSDPRP